MKADEIQSTMYLSLMEASEPSWKKVQRFQHN
jgi:hypothetical protein